VVDKLTASRSWHHARRAEGADSLEREGEGERVHRRRGEEREGRLAAVGRESVGKHHIPPLILVGDAVGLGVLALRRNSVPLRSAARKGTRCPLKIRTQVGSESA